MCRKSLLFLICARTDSQIPPHENATAPIARLNHRRKASTTASVRQTLSAHVSAARAETARGWLHVPLVMSESVTAREDTATVFDTETCVPTPIPLPKKYSLKSRTTLYSETHNTPFRSVPTSNQDLYNLYGSSSYLSMIFCRALFIDFVSFWNVDATVSAFTPSRTRSSTEVMPPREL